MASLRACSQTPLQALSPCKKVRATVDDNGKGTATVTEIGKELPTTEEVVNGATTKIGANFGISSTTFGAILARIPTQLPAGNNFTHNFDPKLVVFQNHQKTFLPPALTSHREEAQQV